MRNTEVYDEFVLVQYIWWILIEVSLFWLIYIVNNVNI